MGFSGATGLFHITTGICIYLFFSLTVCSSDKNAKFKIKSSIQWKEPDLVLPAHVKGLLTAQAIEEMRKDVKNNADELQYVPAGKQLDDLLLSKEGQPIRHVILSTWRSGSTFLSQMLDQFPNTLLINEPLYHMGFSRIRTKTEEQEAMKFYDHLFHCNFTILDHRYIERAHMDFFMSESKVWDLCNKNHDFCTSKEYLETMCKELPLQIIKGYRLRLKSARNLFDNSNYNTKILYVVRDPRAIYISRLNMKGCVDKQDCADSATMCADLLQDYYEARILRTEYPERFMVLRYEDVVQTIDKSAKNIAKFFGLPFSKHMQEYLKNHTTTTDDKFFSTYRETKKMAFQWMESYKKAFPLLENVQDTCSLAMKVWGYKYVREERLGKMNPLKDITFSHPSVVIKDDL